MILPLTKNIYAYAQHILSNPTDAADITQEVMIKLWNTRRELKGVQNPRAWALKVTRKTKIIQAIPCRKSKPRTP